MNVSPINSGTVEIDESEPSSYPVTTTVASGSSITVEALPAPGYRFVNWDGDLDGNTNPDTIAITCDKEVTANFEPAEKVVTIEVEGSGSTTPAAGIHNIGVGNTLSLIATPDSGWQFGGWTGSVAEPDRETTTLLVDADKTVIANFTQLKINWWMFGSILFALAAVILVTSSAVFRNKDS